MLTLSLSNIFIIDIRTVNILKKIFFSSEKYVTKHTKILNLVRFIKWRSFLSCLFWMIQKLGLRVSSRVDFSSLHSITLHIISINLICRVTSLSCRSTWQTNWFANWMTIFVRNSVSLGRDATFAGSWYFNKTFNNVLAEIS